MPIRTDIAMGTLVTMQIVRSPAEASSYASNDVSPDAAFDRAFGWFHEIEARCTRFSEGSELMQLTAQPGVPVAASAILYEAVRFALLVAEETGGAFDPAIGHRMHSRGFNREHRTGEIAPAPLTESGAASYRDIHLDPDRRTITLARPLTLDLGAVAKGLAVDMAARELAPFRDFAIDAGGDLYLGGCNPQGAPWSVGIRHPRRDDELIQSLQVSDKAVCTSGDYERRTPAGHHILDPRTGQPAPSVASATVVASGAMLADALATAVFVLGPADGIELLNRMGVEGLIVTPICSGARREASAMGRRIRRFFKTPKGLLTLIFAIFIAIAAPGQGLRVVAPGLLAAMAAAGLVDTLILRVRKNLWEFPSGAVLTAMIVAMVLRAQEPWYVTTVTSVAAVVSKYIFRSRTANIFNPAALAIIGSFYVFHTGQSWWGALTDLFPIAKVLLIAGGFYITGRVNKMPLVVTFLGAYFVLFTVMAFVGSPLSVAEIFRTPDVEAAIYFACFILTDPPTSPAKYPDQMICGVLVAVVSFAVFEATGAVYYLLAGVLVGNLWEAWRRWKRSSRPAGVDARAGVLLR